MSSRPISALQLAKMRPRLRFHSLKAVNGDAAKNRGRRLPQAEDFQVMSELPQSMPILDRELRAIEVLLGRELQDLLAGHPSDCSENSC
jgi:hypothetical protein